MSDTRINKFIFKDENVFLRLKTTAKNLRVKKKETGYIIEVLTFVPKRMLTQVPVLWCSDFKGEDSVHADALELGYDKDKSGTVSNANVTLIEESWGEHFNLRTPDKHATYHYVRPAGKDFAVKVGPIFKSIEGKELDIDWANLQWGEA